jgi:UPF0716 protein FxsA
MRLILFFAFLVVPLIEIGLFIAVGSRIGIFPTLALCVLTALIGSVLVRHQGLRTMARLQDELNAGRMPTMELAEGAAILAGGLLLITPGFFTDTLGFILLVPGSRRWVIRKLAAHLGGRVHVLHPWPDMAPTHHHEDIIIEGEAEDITEEGDLGGGPRNPDSPWRR